MEGRTEMKTICVVLNYNDAPTTVNMVQSICGYEALDGIVVVDNASTDDSFERCRELANENIHVIRTKKNGGYGYGNNRGIRYAHKALNADYVLIANPDVEVSESCIEAMKRTLDEEKNCAAVSAMVKGPSGEPQFSCWKVCGFLGDLLDTGLITRRLFRFWLQDKRCESDQREEKRLVVDAVPGSLFMANAEFLIECGLYDERVFLYYEEKILAQKFKKHGFKTILLTEESYVHRHSVSINKSVGSILKKQAIQHRSKLYYYKKYLRLNKVQMLFAKAVLYLIMAEIWFLTRVLHMTW